MLADGRTLQLNVSSISGTAGGAILKYAWHDYPPMTVYSFESGRPAPPFNVSVGVPPPPPPAAAEPHAEL